MNLTPMGGEGGAVQADETTTAIREAVRRATRRPQEEIANRGAIDKTPAGPAPSRLHGQATAEAWQNPLQATYVAIQLSPMKANSTPFSASSFGDHHGRHGWKPARLFSLAGRPHHERGREFLRQFQAQHERHYRFCEQHLRATCRVRSSATTMAPASAYLTGKRTANGPQRCRGQAPDVPAD